MSVLRRVLNARAEREADAVPAAERFSSARVTKQAAAGANVETRWESSEFGKNPVKNSADLERILALPRRAVPDADAVERMRDEMTARLSNGAPSAWRAEFDRVLATGLKDDAAVAELGARIKAGAKPTPGGCRCHELSPHWKSPADCITRLNGIQARYLYEAAEVNGALGPIAVGAGKTGIDVLTAMVVPDCKQAVLLVPPGLKPQFLADFARWAQHFKVPNIAGGAGAGPRGERVPGRPVLHVLKYSELSAPGFATWFQARPEITVVIADEAQALKDRTATRVKRFLNHFIENDHCRFFCHTGSLTSKGIEDYSHLSALALREGSPVPIEPHVVTSWGEALNPPRRGLPAPPGALMRFCEGKETVHEGFRRRLIETRGVVATFEASWPGELRFSVRNPPTMPPEVKLELHKVRTTATRPDGEKLQDALEVASVVRHVACGFYMYWNYPGAVPADFDKGGRIDDWFSKRQAWNSEVRAKLERYVPEMDSEGLLKAAARRHLDGYEGDKPVWKSKTWEDWAEVEKTVPHETRVHWTSDWLARDAAAWMLEQEKAGRPGIVWTLNPEMGRLIAKIAARPYYGEGHDAAVAIDLETGSRSMVASIPAHHRGRNLQKAFAANLIVQPPSDAGVWEQLIGRTARQGQPRAFITVEMYQHVAELAESFDVAMGRAAYVTKTTGADQKLLKAR
jgi:hypothetical protein